jgi:hypothetical protein
LTLSTLVGCASLGLFPVCNRLSLPSLPRRRFVKFPRSLSLKMVQNGWCTLQRGGLQSPRRFGRLLGVGFRSWLGLVIPVRTRPSRRTTSNKSNSIDETKSEVCEVYGLRPRHCVGDSRPRQHTAVSTFNQRISQDVPLRERPFWLMSRADCCRCPPCPYCWR